MKLNPEDLNVTSFDVEPEYQEDVATIITNPNDPTPATFCRICPEGTTNCQY
jgi:hypothetical protein